VVDAARGTCEVEAFRLLIAWDLKDKKTPPTCWSSPVVCGKIITSRKRRKRATMAVHMLVVCLLCSRRVHNCIEERVREGKAAGALASAVVPVTPGRAGSAAQADSSDCSHRAHNCKEELAREGKAAGALALAAAAAARALGGRDGAGRTGTAVPDRRRPPPPSRRQRQAPRPCSSRSTWIGTASKCLQ
jgi:hypothetical protein